MTLQSSLTASVESGAVAFTYVVENAGDAPVELQFRDSQRFDLVVRDGGEVWRWSEGRMFAQALGSATVEPGERESFEATWEDPAPGEYEAVATLAADGVDCEARTRFQV